MSSIDHELLYASAKASVHFALLCLEPLGKNLRLRSSFVTPDGSPMRWHEFGDLDGPGWAANSVGGAHLLYRWGVFCHDEMIQETALKLLDHILEDGFIDHGSGLIYPYFDLGSQRFCWNYTHGQDWLCPGSLARVGTQLLEFCSDLANDSRVTQMQQAAAGLGEWLSTKVGKLPNGWLPRRITPQGEPYPFTPEGKLDAIFDCSADGLFLVQFWTELGQHGFPGYNHLAKSAGEAFLEAGGFFGSINHDTYDQHENVAYASAFRILRQAGRFLGLLEWQDFAYQTALTGLASFQINENRNGVPTKDLFFMEKSWNTAYLWENAEGALAFLEAGSETQHAGYLEIGLANLQAIAAHHHTNSGFLSEGVDWDNHVSRRHHIRGELYGDICYTEPLLNNLHLLAPTLFYFQHAHLQPAEPMDDQRAIQKLKEHRERLIPSSRGKHGVRYMPRLYFPTVETNERLNQAIEFTKRCKADTVLLLEGSYDMDTALLTWEALRERFTRWKTIIPIFKKIVPEVHINVMINLGHVDGGCGQPEYFPFQFMVDEFGNRSKSTACPMDPLFLKQIEAVLHLAAECQPDAIWIDDDARFFWQDVPGMTCFCDQHLVAFQARTGQKWTREALVKEMKDDTLDPRLRQIWFDLQEETILNLAIIIERAIHKINHTIQIGLMSTGQSSQAAEGRHIDRLLRILAGQNRPMISLGSGFYTYERPLDVFDKSQVCARELFFVGDDCRCVAEVENHPYTPFGKSERILSLELLLDVLNGMPDLSLNSLSSTTGSGPLVPEGSDYARFLTRQRPFLDSLAKEWAGKQRLGIGIADHQNIARQDRLYGQDLIGRVFPRPWESVLARLGFPLGRPDGTPHWLTGEIIYAISDYELTWMLREGSVLDPLAVQGLIERGFGKKLGIEKVNRVSNPVNEVFQKDPLTERQTGQILPFYDQLPYDLLYTYRISNPEARVLSRWLDVNQQDQGPALTILQSPELVFNMEMPWKVALLPYSLTAPSIALLNFCYRETWAGVLKEISHTPLPARVSKGLNIYPMVFVSEDKTRWMIVAINFSADKVKNCELEVPACHPADWQIESLQKDGTWKVTGSMSTNCIKIELEAFSASVLRLQKLGE